MYDRNRERKIMDVSGFSQSDLIQGHFIVYGKHAQIETHARPSQKIFVPLDIPILEVPLAPSNKLFPTKKVSLRGRPHETR